ncbi:MAG: septal ring lytic transglycosylase RlpA family protein [Bacteroidota bacterium]
MRFLLAVMITLMTCPLLSAQEEFGIASYYSDAFDGRKTASGEVYDKTKLTAAHKKLPFGTIIKVTRLDNRSSVKVRINDNGPYIKGRIVELSRKAAERLGIIRDGHAKVKIEVVGQVSTEPNPTEPPPAPTAASPADVEAVASSSRPEVEEYSEELVLNEKPANLEPINIEIGRTSSSDDAPQASSEPAKPKPSAPKPAPKAEEPTPEIETPQATPVAQPIADAPSKPRVAAAPIAKGSTYQNYDLYQIQLLRPAKTGYGVQIASMTQYENVLKRVAELQEKWFKNILLSVEKGTEKAPIYKIILGPFDDQQSAQAYKNQLKKKKKIDGFVVSLGDIQY